MASNAEYLAKKHEILLAQMAAVQKEMAKLQEPRKAPEKKKYNILDSSSPDEDDENDGEDSAMKESASVLIDTKPK